jgi:hypothetical protein
VPIDTTLHRFRRVGADVTVETSPGGPVVDGIGALRFSDGTHREFEALFDGIELFVPGHGPFRSAVDEGQIWKFRRIMSLDVLLELGEGPGLQGQLYAAARYARRHDLLIRISY